MSSIFSNPHSALIVLLIGLSCPMMVCGQQGFSIGIQSTYGIGRLTLTTDPGGAVIETSPGFSTAGSIYLHWNSTKLFGFRFQAEGLVQTLSYRVTGTELFGASSGWTFGQTAASLQAHINVPVFNSKTLHAEAFTGIGLRGSNQEDNGCSFGLEGAIAPNDSIGTASFNAYRTSGSGSQIEVAGGVRFIQQINQNRQRPLYLTFGLTYRQALAPLVSIEGISYSEDIELIQGPNGIAQFPWQNILQDCQEAFSNRPEAPYTVQHLGTQLDINVGMQLGL